jgi:Trypsin-co-occurring domain 1
MAVTIVQLTDRVLLEPEEGTKLQPAPPPHEGAAGLEDAVDRLKDVSDSIAAVCEGIYQTVRERLQAVGAPSEFGLEFGVKLSGELGVPFISKAAGEATFKVTAKWENSSSKEDGNHV